MQSLKNRIGDKREEFLEFTRDYGRGAAMDKYGICDYVALHKLLAGWTEDENFGINPRISGTPNHEVETFRDKIRKHKEQDRKRILEMVSENKRLKMENEALRQMVSDKFGSVIKGLIEELDEPA